MTDTSVTALLIGLIIAYVASTGVIWRKLGQLENAVKKSCPFGKCPIFERSKHEAAPNRKEAAE